MNEIALFLVALFGITWPLGYFLTPWAMSRGQLTFEVTFVTMVWIPTIVALTLTRITGGPGSVARELRARFRLVKGSTVLIVVAGLVPLAVGAIGIVAARLAGDGLPFIARADVPFTIFLQVITGGTGEELGWRGFLLPRLQSRIGPAAAAIVMALLWACWHVPVFYTPGMPHRFMPMGSMLALIALFGMFLGILFFASSESVVPTMAAHVSLNVILALGGASLNSVVFWRTLAATYAMIVVAVALRARARIASVTAAPTPA